MSQCSSPVSSGRLAFLFVAFFLLYQTSLAVSPLRFPEVWYFGADSQEQLFRNPLSDWVAKKHPLFALLATPLFHFASIVYSSLPEPLSVNLALAFPVAVFGAASVALGYWLFRRLGSDHEVALLFAALYGLGASTWVFASFPDTYMLTSFATVVFFCTYVVVRASTSWSAVANAAAALASPQQVFLVIVPVYSFLRSEAFCSAARRAIQYGLILLILFVVPYEMWLTTSDEFGHRPDTAVLYFRSYSSLSNFIAPESYGTILLNFFVFSLAGPSSRPFTYRFPFRTTGELFQPFWIGVVVLYAMLAVISLHGLRKAHTESRRLVEGILLFVVFQGAFFLYFNPVEAFIYSGPLLFPWLLVLHEGFRQRTSRCCRALLAAVVLTVGWAIYS